MSITTINPFAPAAFEWEQWRAWEESVTDRRLALQTATLRLFNIGAAVNSMTIKVPSEDETVYEGLIGTWADGTDTTALPVSATLAGLVTNYTLLQVEDEQVVVKSVDRTANTIDVYKRGHGGTTGAAHANTVSAKIISHNYVVGSKDIESRVLGDTVYTYYVAKNTIPSVTFTKEDLNIKRQSFGEEGRMDYVMSQISRMDKELLIEMNKSVIYSGGEAATATTPGSVVGILAEAMTRGNIVSSFGAITIEKIEAGLTASRNKGGFANVVLCGAAAFDKINSLANYDLTVSVPDRLQIVLGASVAAISTKVGLLAPVLDTSFPDDKFVVLNTDGLFWAPLTGFELPGADRTLAQESTRNDQQFVVDSITQGATYYLDTNKDMTIFTGVTY